MSARANRRGAGAGAEKPWASGRILTPEQRARKQEVDRRANRVLKKEVQERLSLLESRVLQLERLCPGITASLGGERGESAHPAGLRDGNQHDERNSERASFGGWPSNQPSNAFQGMPPTWNDTISAWSTQLDPTDRSAHGSVSTPAHYDHLDSMTDKSSWPGGPSQPADMQNCPYARDFVQPTANTTTIMPSPAQQDSGYSPKKDDLFTTARLKPNGREITTTLSRLVNFVRSIPAAQICFDDHINQDLVITAIFKGWEFALSRYQQGCPLWNVLQLVDLSLFRFCNMVERLSVLRILHKMYLFEAGSRLNGLEGPLPAWYKPQASWQLISHEPVIDHIAWPRLREHLVIAENNTLTNKFWEQLVRNFRFTWNDQPLTSIQFQPETSTYRLSPVFESALMHNSNWRMDISFLNVFPELANDIHAANYMPLTIIQPSFGLEEKEAAERKLLQKGFNNSSIEFMMPSDPEEGEPPPIPIQGGPWHPGPRSAHSSLG